MKKATVKKVDKLGRIVLPQEMRKILDIKCKDELNVSVQKNYILLSKHIKGCLFNNEPENKIAYKGHCLCHNCNKNISKMT